MKERIKTSRRIELDEYLDSNMDVDSWSYDGDGYLILFQSWVSDYRIKQIIKLIKVCTLGD